MSPLPFDSLRDTETVNIEGLLLPKHGSLTVAEERAVRDLQAELDASEERANLTPAQGDLELRERVATILIRSRLDKNWSLEKTRGEKWEIVEDGAVKDIEPTMLLLDALFDFFLNEQRRWRDPETLPDSPDDGSKKKGSSGKRSTGSSGSTTQEKNGSAPKDLAIAQSA